MDWWWWRWWLLYIIIVFVFFLRLCHFLKHTKLGLINIWTGFHRFSQTGTEPVDPATFFHDLQPRPLFNDNVIIPYFSDPDFRNVTFEKMPLGVVPGPCFEDHLLHLSKKMSCSCTIPLEGASKLHCRGTVESCYATVAYGIYLFLTCSPDDKAITRHSFSAFSVTPTASEAR